MARLFRLFLAGYLVTALGPRGTAAPPQSDISQIEQLIRQTRGAQSSGNVSPPAKLWALSASRRSGHSAGQSRLVATPRYADAQET